MLDKNNRPFWFALGLFWNHSRQGFTWVDVGDMAVLAALGWYCWELTAAKRESYRSLAWVAIIVWHSAARYATRGRTWDEWVFSTSVLLLLVLGWMWFREWRRQNVEV